MFLDIFIYKSYISREECRYNNFWLQFVFIQYTMYCFMFETMNNFYNNFNIHAIKCIVTTKSLSAIKSLHPISPTFIIGRRDIVVGVDRKYWKSRLRNLTYWYPSVISVLQHLFLEGVLWIWKYYLHMVLAIWVM